MTLRKFGSRSAVDLKSEQNLKSLIRSELRDLINDSVHDYLQKNRIPVATIDINVDKDCSHCYYNSQRESSRAVRLNISTSSMDASTEANKKQEDANVASKEEDNQHWMTWKTNDDTQFNGRSKNLRNYRCQTPMSANSLRCSSPFTRPNTTTSHGADREEYREIGQRYRSVGMEPRRSLRFEKVDKVIGTQIPKTSVAVGPDKHFEERGTNTQKSYQISDYLKKNMDLEDPYERNVYSSLMEVMRKRANHTHGQDSVAGDADPIIQISEYKYKYQNPRTKVAIPTSNTHTLATVKKPPLCPHKTRPLGLLRPQSSSCTPKFRFGEQFLF